MKKIAILSLALVSSAAWASHEGGSYTVSDNASASACFGQARAHDASSDQYDPIGAIFASRGGMNAVLNRAFRLDCLG